MTDSFKSTLCGRKNFCRALYNPNSELLNLALERFREASVSTTNKLRAKWLNIIVNGYGLRMYRRRYGYDYSENFLNSAVSSEGTAVSDPMMPCREAFEEALETAKAVTFDVFDTLLVRRVAHPSDVFKLIEDASQKNAGFAEERMRAEARARHLCGPEVELSDIYRTISPKFRRLMTDELAFERRLLVRNEAAYQLYRLALEKGVKLAAVSDMYLPASFLREVLLEAGYEKISDVFVSGEYKCSKCVGGKLFEKAAEKLGVRPEEILHIGDSRRSDFEMAQQAHCRSILIPTEKQCFEVKPDARFRAKDDFTLPRSMHNALIRGFRDDGRYFRKLGFMLGGPLALGYLTWLNNEIEAAEADCVLFIARDGWLLRELYEAHFNPRSVRTGYVYFNRILGLKAFATYLGERHYLAVLLRRAHKYLGTPAPTDDFKSNESIFRKIEPALIDWGRPLRGELTRHAEKEAGEAERIVTVDLGTGRFASLDFASRIFGEKLINSYFYATVRDDREKAVYSTMLNEKATSRELIVSNTNVDGGKINLMELMEILISSPEPRIIDLKDGSPVYDGSGDQKPFYGDIAEGIREYVRDFLSAANPTTGNTIGPREWLSLARRFVERLNEEDLRALSCIEFCAAADNESAAHRPFTPAVKSRSNGRR